LRNLQRVPADSLYRQKPSLRLHAVKVLVQGDEDKVTQHIGIVAGSAEGAALCYRTICLEASAVMGEHNHPEVTMNSLPMAEHMRHIRANDWKAVAETLAASAHKVAKAGADFAICP